jgi:hypothetical protein
MNNEKCQMSKFKIQMADKGARATSTKLTDTDTKHKDNEHGHTTRTLREGTRVFPHEKYIPI